MNRAPKPMRLFVDQYGHTIYARTIKELRVKCGGGRVSHMYHDYADGRTYRIGYVVGALWFAEYAPVRVKQ